MQTDQDLIELIKEAYPLNPSEEFISNTSTNLRQAARKLNRKRRMNHFSISIASIGIVTLVMAWFFFYDGKTLLLNNLNSLAGESSFSTVRNEEPLVYIYQSHNLESFTTETDTSDPDKAFHETKNITLVGARLSQSLKERGINTIHDETDTMGILKEKNLPYSESYSISREPLTTTLANNNSIKMVFDIHRDSQKREHTTVTLNEQDYSKVVFVVSRSSSKYVENLNIAELLHSKLEEKYPGLSRGVIVKDNVQGLQSTYNQDLIGNSVHLEIGGYENTLQEEYRTVDILAEMIQEILEGE